MTKMTFRFINGLQWLFLDRCNELISIKIESIKYSILKLLSGIKLLVKLFISYCLQWFANSVLQTIFSGKIRLIKLVKLNGLQRTQIYVLQDIHLYTHINVYICNIYTVLQAIIIG